MPTISVILPYDGQEKFRQRLLTTIAAIRAQDHPDTEVVVSQIGPSPPAELIAGVTHVHHPYQGPFNAAPARNHGARAATGEILLFSDCDIIFERNDYFSHLRELLDRFPGKGLCMPPLRKLSLDDFPAFAALISESGFAHAHSRLDFSTPHLAILGRATRTRVERTVDSGQLYTLVATEEDYRRMEAEVAASDGDESGKGFFGRFFTMGNHHGTLCIMKDAFEKIGGYCTDYRGWGAEDLDMYWKVLTVYGVRRIAQAVIHLDHPRDHVRQEHWDRNQERLRARKKLGIEKVVASDRAGYNE